MLKEERWKIILDILQKQEFVKNQELAQITGATIQTIISDITYLEQEKKLVKVYGGAKSLVISNNQEQFDEEKVKQNWKEKALIGQKAARLVTDNSLIFIDTGTTTSHIIRFLHAKNLTIVTNGYNIAKELSEYGFEVILLGGQLLAKTKALVGVITLQLIATFNFDYAFIGANGVDKEGIYTTNLEEAAIKSQIAAHSKKNYVLIDSNKINKKARIKILFKEPITFISDIVIPFNFS